MRVSKDVLRASLATDIPCILVLRVSKDVLRASLATDIPCILV